MAKDYAAKFYNSKAWRKCRAGYISNRVLIDGGLCEVCRNEQGYIVHHIIKLTAQNVGDASVSLNWDNMRYECKACHDMEEDHWLDSKGIKKSNAIFGADGQPIDRRRIE